jgi:hypothetical protein
MNKIVTVLSLLLISSTVLAGDLDGKTFCRSVQSDGMFGQPKGTREHCVSFKNNIMVDNANTFFGNAPDSENYALVDRKILVIKGGSLLSPYSIDENSTQLFNESGAVLSIR